MGETLASPRMTEIDLLDNLEKNKFCDTYIWSLKYMVLKVEGYF